MSETRGIVVLAQNNNKDNYVLQACVLAMSLYATNPGEKISIITNDTVSDNYKKFFDKIIPIPYNDDAEKSDWKIENRWKIYHASPYDKTIVLDTDMLILQDITEWWEILDNYEMFFTSNVLTYRGDVITNDFYRKAFTANHLPNLYSGLHYFKKGDFALEFYTWLELVMNNWEFFYGNYVKQHYPTRASVDVSAAIVAKILDCENDITNKNIKFPSFTHMKPRVQNWKNPTDKWQDKLGIYIDKKCNLKLGNHIQTGILHYTEKDFINEMVVERYRNYLHV